MKVLIWGTGEYAYKVYEHISYINEKNKEKLYEIAGFIDNDKSRVGNFFLDKIILSPQMITKDHLPIVIGVGNSEAIVKQINEEIGGIYYTYYDFVCRDLPLEISSSNYNYESEISEKINLQRRLIKDVDTRKIQDDKLIAATASIFSRDLKSANSFLNNSFIENTKIIKRENKTIAMYYYKYSNGGVERVISHLINEFNQKGYAVFLVTDMFNTKEDYSIPEGVNSYQMPVKPHENYFEWFIEISKFLEDKNIDCLVSHQSYWEGNFYLYKICKSKNIKFLVEVHNHYTGFVGNELEYFKLLYKNSDGVVVLSEDDVSFWRNQEVKSVCIPNPVLSGKKRREETNGINILWIGRISIFQKNVLDIVRAAKIVCEKIPKAKFNIVGAFENVKTQKAFLDLIEEYNLKQNFIMHGYKTDVEEYYLNANIMILTSEFEGFPMTVAEAMSHGVPVVLYELNYLELFKSRKGYLSVPQKDYKKLGEQIVKVLSDEILYKKLSDEAFEVAEEFSKNDMVSLWENVIR